jgi:hypothetical protein
MTYKLVILPTKNIVVEEDVMPKEDEKFYWFEDGLNYGTEFLKHYDTDGGMYESITGKGVLDTHVVGRVVATGIGIDYSLLTEEVKDNYGIIDVAQFALDTVGGYIEDLDDNLIHDGFIEGAYTIQSLAEKTYSLEDIVAAVEHGRFDDNPLDPIRLDNFIKEISAPKIFTVELQMNTFESPQIPNLSNGQVKILKIL